MAWDPKTFPEHEDYLLSLARLLLRADPLPALDQGDAVNQTCLQATIAFQSCIVETFRGQRAWLAEILRNVIHNAHRRPGRPGPLPEAAGNSSWSFGFNFVDDHTTPSGNALRRERIEQVQSALEYLSPAEQSALRLRHVEGKSLAEIAAEMNLDVAEVVKLLRQAEEILRESLDAEASSQ